MLHTPQCLFRDWYFECETVEVGEDKTLGVDINFVDEIAVDDEPLAQTDEHGGSIAKLFGKRDFHLSEIHAQDTRQLVGGNNLCIVTVSLEVNNVGDAQPDKLVARIEQDIIHWLVSSLRCSPCGRFLFLVDWYVYEKGAGDCTVTRPTHRGSGLPTVVERATQRPTPVCTSYL